MTKPQEQPLPPAATALTEEMVKDFKASLSVFYDAEKPMPRLDAA